jgi:hypothetical protein
MEVEVEEAEVEGGVHREVFMENPLVLHLLIHPILPTEEVGCRRTAAILVTFLLFRLSLLKQTKTRLRGNQ